ncbi:MAG: GNAT family N-acetyltransferase [Maritimibacter sp.]|nr:GNAT family N-acetyltransferase [Maritimibacter sp.]
MPQAEIRLVELTPATAKALGDVADDVFDAVIDPARLAEFVADPRHLLWFAEAGGQVVGFASATELFHPDKPPQIFINEIGVAPAWRRRGIGRALVEKLVAAARERGCNYAWLGTDTDNTAGNACFRSVPGSERAGSFVMWEWQPGGKSA